MKYLKRIFTFCAVLFTVASFAACGGSDDGKDDGGGSGGSTDFVVSTSSKTFSSTGGTTDFSVSASKKPTVTASESWVHVTEKTSTSSSVYRYDLTADANTDTDDRTATVTITVGSTSKTITVTQTSADGLVISSEKSVSIGAEGGSVTVKLRSNGDYTVNSSAEWVTSTRANMQDYEEKFTVAANVGAERTAQISFTLNDITESVTITQAAGTTSGEITANAKEIAKKMYPGWNLGNTLDASSTSGKGSLSSETSWQSTMTTQAIIDYVKEQGFKSVRIPCAWYYHSTDGDIDSKWMSRVQEVVDYCIKDGLYVVLNDHWDGGWIEVQGFSESTSTYKKATDATVSSKSEMLKKIWTQIANKFKDYDEHLVFAGMNEPFQEYSLFNNHHAELTPILVKYNQAFVDAVRATGGNNAKRTLVVQGPSVNIDSSCKDVFTMPTDLNSQTGYLMAEVHFYDPYDFALNESGTFYYWGSANHVSGSSYNATYGEESYIKEQMAKLKTKFYDNGYPVIIGEYGANWRDLSSVTGAKQSNHNASIKLWYQTVTQEAVNNGCVPFAWDINVANQSGTKGVMTIINRSTLSVFGTYALEGIQAGAKAATMP